MPTPSPTMVVMFNTNTDMGVYRAARVTKPSAMVIASRPTRTGSAAATSAPKATISTASVERQGALLAPLRVLRADGAHVVVERGEPGDHDLEPLRARDPRQRVPDRRAQVGDETGAQVMGGFRGERRNQEGRAAVLADETRLPDRTAEITSPT